MAGKAARDVRGLMLAGALMALSGLAPGVALAADACRDDRVTLRDGAAQASFRVEIADDDAERQQGLMNRERMSSGAGMLFVWDEPQRFSAFWMKNTLIPLDILFMDATGRVQAIQHGKPLDETSLPGGENVQYVLEINGGLAEKLGLGVGAQMQSPFVGQDRALWPCAVSE